MAYRRVASLKSPADFVAYLRSLAVELPVDSSVSSGPNSPLSAPIKLAGATIGNRFCILPMEGWDGTREGKPTDLTRRRWRNFGGSGAKLIWGGEAVAVRQDGRATQTSY